LVSCIVRRLTAGTSDFSHLNRSASTEATSGAESQRGKGATIASERPGCLTDMRYCGIIFDFNGVLVWDAALHTESWNGVAKELRGRELTDEECAVHMHGRPVAYVLSYLAGREVTGRELQDLTDRKESLYRRLCLANPRTFVLSPGARELLDALTVCNIPRTIATSSEKTNLDFFRAQLGLDRWFDPLGIVYDDGSRPGKPAPDMFLAAAEIIGLKPCECIVIEDAVSGLQAAHAAGIGYIIGLGPEPTHAGLLACDGVATVIDSLAQFPGKLLLGCC
jgi:beta-phosphoglucomutase